jgi:S-DNA-T family DNA segregation ATPase FtsK/SpoIIIE
MPAPVIVVDEYAELADEAPTPSSTPTPSPGGGEQSPSTSSPRPSVRPRRPWATVVRTQMDVRISFRVRERKDVDLILG